MTTKLKVRQSKKKSTTATPPPGANCSNCKLRGDEKVIRDFYHCKLQKADVNGAMLCNRWEGPKEGTTLSPLPPAIIYTKIKKGDK